MDVGAENTPPSPLASPAKMASPAKPVTRYDALIDVATLRADLRQERLIAF